MQRGFSLLHVMVMLSAASTLLMIDARFSYQRSDYRALEYTLLQTESMLNAAYAHYRDRGFWPRTSSASDCVMPLELLGHLHEVRNGWGEIISAQCESGSGTSYYVLQQQVPRKWLAHLQARLDGVQVLTGGSTEDADLMIRLDTTGGAIHHMQFLPLPEDGGARFMRACEEGEHARYFMGLNAMFAYLYDDEQSEVTFLFEPVFNGYRYGNTSETDGIAAQYHMFRYRSDGSITDRSAHEGLDPDEHGEIYKDDLADGNYNAESRCQGECTHILDKQVKAAFFSWCEPSA